MSLADAPLEDLADQINTIARLTGTFTLRSGQIASTSAPSTMANTTASHGAVSTGNISREL